MAVSSSSISNRSFAGHLAVRLRSACGQAFRHLFKALPAYPWLIVFLVAYAVLRVTLNLSIGITWDNAIRPLVIGLLIHAFSVLLIDTLYHLGPWPAQDCSEKVDPRPARNLAALSFWFMVWLFWAVQIVDGLQRRGAMAGRPLLEGLPGWLLFNQALLAAGQWLSACLLDLPPVFYQALISGLLFRVLLPILILPLLGYRAALGGFSFRRWQIAAPFLLIGLGAWAANGVSIRSLAVLGLVFLYPGLTEEWYDRGWLQPMLRSWLRPGYAILLTAILFGLLHLPEYVFVRYTDALALALTNMGDVMLVGLVWGYGVYRSRSILPWALYHALSDLVGF